MKLSAIRQDMEAQTQGVWAEFSSGVLFRISRYGSKEQDKWQRSAMEALGEDPSEEARAAVVMESVGRFNIKDWRGIHDEDDSEIPYTAESAVEIMKDESLEDLRAFIFGIATNKQRFRLKRKEAALGNSLSASDGASTTDRTSSN